MKITFALLFTLLFTIACGEQKAEDNKAQKTEEKASDATDKEDHTPKTTETEEQQALAAYRKFNEINCKCRKEVAEQDKKALGKCMEANKAGDYMDKFNNLYNKLGGGQNQALTNKTNAIDQEMEGC